MNCRRFQKYYSTVKRGYYDVILDSRIPIVSHSSNFTKKTNSFAVSKNINERNSLPTEQTDSMLLKESTKPLNKELVAHITNLSQLELFEKDVKAPPAPGSEECCMSGCAICVWDIYSDEFNLYKEKKELIKLKREELGVKVEEVVEEMVQMDESMKVFLEMERQMKKKNESSVI
ncbi:hypothetical protein HDV02_005178 [Globomyces sp. JEL0801]|nr:hypothetical protein HDV02_005178 [Globomyces sp. JEL0801]